MPNKAGWIDFRALCKSVQFRQVFELYNVQLNVKGDRAQGFCPLPGHQGQKRSPSFSADIRKGIWQCFGCGAKGNILDFTARMEGLDPFKGKDVRRAAEILQEKLGLASSVAPPVRPDSREVERRADQAPAVTSAHNAVINAPLDFELKDLDPAHPYLRGRGLTPSTISHFGLGFCNRGTLKGRIAIPIHDATGELVAYAGRLVDDRAINNDNPKYKLPAPRERHGKIYEFHKSNLLYNAHRIRTKVPDLVVVEGFASVWWLHQHDFKDVIAIMGSDCSNTQAKLILEKVETDGRVWILTDGDDAGHRCAESLLAQLAPYRFVRWARLKDGEQPTDLSVDELDVLLGR